MAKIKKIIKNIGWPIWFLIEAAYLIIQAACTIAYNKTSKTKYLIANMAMLVAELSAYFRGTIDLANSIF